MRRFKRHKVKREKPETSTSLAHDEEEHDLAYYIHDRVELMHQVFSSIKYRQLKAMAPECVRHISIDDLQELCTEELLGISSKRLCAILDGADPPSDTESSSSPSLDNLETISLDSISSDEEILSQDSSKKSKKHKHRHSKSKSKHKKSVVEASPPKDVEQSRASRAGLTVLELLELQARARAIRAQLQQDQLRKQASESVALESSPHSSDGEVEIKEEPAVVVEISSDEEKPKIEKLTIEDPTTSKPPNPPETAAITKRVNELIITVPQAKTTRKIKLNRTKAPTNERPAEKITSVASNQIVTNTPEIGKNDVEMIKKDKVKRKRKGKKKKVDKSGSDHDEITLQLSDTEKMDLLEDLGRKSYDNVDLMDSGSSLDTDSDSSDTDVPTDNEESTAASTVNSINEKTIVQSDVVNKEKIDVNMKEDPVSNDLKENVTSNLDITSDIPEQDIRMNTETDSNVSEKDTSDAVATKNVNKVCEDNQVITNTENESDSTNNMNIKITINEKDRKVTLNNTESVPESASKSEAIDSTNDRVIEITKISDIPIQESSKRDTQGESEIAIREAGETIVSTEVKENDKELSDGELSGKDSSEVEAVDLKTEVVCISDEEKEQAPKKKKKKDKKSKKMKKSKKKDFRESADQNFYTDTHKQNLISIDVPSATEKQDDIYVIEIKTLSDKQTHTEIITNDLITTDKSKQTDTAHNIKENTDKEISDVTSVHDEPIKRDLETVDLDDVYEILELSDDSSCYEVEGTVLSKEPTSEEIEALSAKIDEIDRVDVVTEQEIKEYESEIAQVENISWKDRYLDSAKVKKVLTTANIFNALRKKNIELKKKIEESKQEMEIVKEIEVEEEVKDETKGVLEGTIEHYNMLQGSTKYVDPVSEVTEDEKGEDRGVTKELKKDAKKLLKMYKRLLKYNDMDKQKDPKKKKKKKKKKDGDTVENKTIPS